MKLPIITTPLLLSLLSTAPSLPTASPLTRMDPHPPLGVYICSQPNWAGTCQWTPLIPSDDTGPCTLIPFTSSPRISFGPDPGVECKVWDDANCSQTPFSYTEVVWPGMDNFPGPRYSDGTVDSGYKSFKCIKATAPEERSLDAATEKVAIATHSTTTLSLNPRAKNGLWICSPPRLARRLQMVPNVDFLSRSPIHGLPIYLLRAGSGCCLYAVHRQVVYC